MDIARPTGADNIKDTRGVAVADLNRDGRLDLVMSNNNNVPTIYMNQLAQSGNWIEFKLIGTSSNRDAIGARVEVRANGKTMTRQVEGGSGYASEAMLPVHFGLGKATRIEAVVIRWPSGFEQRLDGEHIGINRQIRVEEGDSKIAAITTVK